MYVYTYIDTYIYIYGFLVCRYASSLGLAAPQNTPALDGAIYDGNGPPSGPNKTIFVGADRLLDASRGRSGGW